MAKSFNMNDRYPSPAPGRIPNSSCKMDGGLQTPGPSPMACMSAPVPGYCAAPAQNPSDCPANGVSCDYTPLAKSDKPKSMVGRTHTPAK